MIYLDQAATSLIKPPDVSEAVLWAMENCASLGRSGHSAAMNAAEVAYRTRKTAAMLFDSSPDQVVFTSNATHSLNIAIRTVVNPGDKVVISGFEHNAVLRTLYHIGANITVAGTNLFDPSDTLQAFEDTIDEETKAVVCTHVSNVFGYTLPVCSIGELCEKQSVPFILDASQSAGVLPLSMKKLHASFIAAPGHKSLYGPQGTGILVCGMKPKPLLYGGTGSNSRDWNMPDELPDLSEAGTHNIPGLAGLNRGIEYVLFRGAESLLKHEVSLMDAMYHGLCDLSSIRLFRDNGSNQTGVLSCVFSGVDSEYAADLLAEKGIAVRAGLHCSPLAHKSADTINTGTVRFSFSAFNTLQEIDSAVSAVRSICRG